jgi:hypothetical protein
LFDELALIAQPPGLSSGGLAQIVVQRNRRTRGASPMLTESFGDARALRNPAALSSAMAVANGEHRSRVAPARIIGCQSLVNVLLRQIESAL